MRTPSTPRLSVVLLAESIARRYEPLGHPMRILILGLLLAYGRLSWSSLMDRLSGLVGAVNPNTLAFHLRKLMEAGYVAKSGSVDKEIYYEATKTAEDVLKDLREIVEMIKALSTEGA